MKSNESPLRTLCLSLTILALGAASAIGETVLIESRNGQGTVGGITPNPPYEEVGGSWSGSGTHTTAGGTTTGVGSRFGFSPMPAPVLTLHPTLIPGDTYRLDISHISPNASPDIVVSLSYGGCTGTATTSTNFNSRVFSPAWETVGTITVGAGVTTPTVTFTYYSGTLASTGGRWYSDAFRFVNLAEPCQTALPELTTVNGPLAAGQTYVDVPAVNALATAVRVYANGVEVGIKSTDIVAGVNRVAVSPLVKNAVITATQANIDSVESCRPTTGPLVGGGPNPPLRMALSIRQNTALTGPIGANGGVTGTILKFLGATGVVGSLGTAPLGAKLVNPNSGWQTVTFLRGPDPANPTDPSFMWNGTDTPNPEQLKGNFGVLESVAIAIGDLDSGPYAIFIDTVKNGDTEIQGFESAAVGAQAVLFTQPSFSGTTTPFLLSQTPGTIAPNVSVVTNSASDLGSQSLLVNWQFKDTNAVNWLRLVAQGSGTPNPQLDLSLPISLRVLVLPVGETPVPQPPTIVESPQNQTALEGGSATFTALARGAGPLHYQWRFNGAPISGANGASLQLTNVQLSDAGFYSVFITNSIDSATSDDAQLIVNALVSSDSMTTLWKLAPGSRPYLANDNSQRGMAYNPLSGNILLVSRTGSNAVHVLDGQTGAHIHTLNSGPEITGGALALNMIGVTPDGLIYAGNLTENGTLDPFKLYVWIDDSPEAFPSVAWQGDPGRGVAQGWGDTLTVRLVGSDHQILLGSRHGALVSLLFPDFGINAEPARFNVPGAAAGNFGQGLAFGSGNEFWGKAVGANIPLLHVELDPDLTSSSILHSYSQYPNMAALGVDPANNLLAGIMIESPDNLRLYDILDLNAPVHLDTEVFPTDNPNPNGTGSVAFGPDTVYALDSNNGLIAMRLHPRIQVARSGVDIVLTWNPAHTLQSSTNVTGTYVNVPNATSPYTVTPQPGTQVFYRTAH